MPGGVRVNEDAVAGTGVSSNMDVGWFTGIEAVGGGVQAVTRNIVTVKSEAIETNL